MDTKIFFLMVIAVATATAYVTNAPCSGHGTLHGDLCHCDDSYVGTQCECPITAVTSSDNCVDPGRDSSVACSGRGLCVCGVCQCQQRPNADETVYGQYCECDNFSCERHSGLLCGGPERGSCECGQCVCNRIYYGSACSDDLS